MLASGISNDCVKPNKKSDAIGYGYDFELGNERIAFRENNYSIFLADYSKMREKHEFFLNKELDNGEIIQLTCYFDPPVEEQ